MALNPKLIAKLGALAKWAASPQGQEKIRKATNFAKDHEQEINSAKNIAKGVAKNVAVNAKQAMKNFKDELRKDD